MSELSKVAKDSAERIGTALGKKTGEAFHRFYNHTGDNLRTVSRNHDENDRNVRDSLHQAARTDEKAPKSPGHSSTPGPGDKRNAPSDGEPGGSKKPKLDGIGPTGKRVKAPGGEDLGVAHSKEELRQHLGPTPVYRIKDDREIVRLTKNGPKALNDEFDKKRLGLVKLDGNKALTGKYNLPKGKSKTRPMTSSKKIPFGSDELSRATQLARHEGDTGKASDVGNYTKDKNAPDGTPPKFGSNNYAAVRYGKEGDKDGFILVGRSRFPTHSERILGQPMVKSGATHRITQVYTERAPCTGAPNCSAWMKHYLPQDVKVTHSVPYGTPAEMAEGNIRMEHYLNTLRSEPHRQFKGQGTP